jgi:hypothetical protein
MSTDNLTIRADVSPSFHPEVLSPHAEALAEKPGALATGQNALAAAYRYLGAINDAEKALQATAAPGKRVQHPTGQSEMLGDLRMAGAGRLKRYSGNEELLAEAAGEALERISKQIDVARGELVATAEMLDKQIAHALTDPAGDTGAILAMQTEIRAHVKGLPDMDRFGFVRSAIKAGDIATTAAILRGQPFLSGLKDEELGHLRVEAAGVFAPTATKQREAVNKIVSAVEGAGSAVLARYAEVDRAKDTPVARAKRKLADLKGAK